MVFLTQKLATVPQATLISTTHNYLVKQASIFAILLIHSINFPELQLFHYDGWLERVALRKFVLNLILI
jgi:hypothetical protein